MVTLGNINNVGYYDYFELLSSNANYNFNDELGEGGVWKRRLLTRLWVGETVALADFSWMDLFDNKPSVTADYYIKNTKDILLGYNVPAENGIWTKKKMNLAKVRIQVLNWQQPTAIRLVTCLIL